MSDFEYEFQMALMNRHLSPGLETVFMIPSVETTYISSSIVREVAQDGGALDGLVPEALDQYWQYTLDFLKIARQWWPAHLKEIKKIEPAARRDLLIEAEAARLTRHHDGPVIAAGSTGSMPSTAKFLHAIARLPHGAVVLPGLVVRSGGFIPARRAGLCDPMHARRDD